MALNIGSRYPFRQHAKLRSPKLNCRRLAKTFSTDTLLSSNKASGGIKCAQIFSGNKSLYTSVYGIQTKSQRPESLEAMCIDHGAPYQLRNENSKMKTGHAWNDIMRKFTIKAETTAPYFKNQNLSENRIGVVKRHTNSIMDQSRAPIQAWLLCMCYVVCILNYYATQTLNLKCAMVTHGISFTYYSMNSLKRCIL